MTDHAIANADHTAGSITREDRAVVIPAPATPALDRHQGGTTTPTATAPARSARP